MVSRSPTRLVLASASPRRRDLLGQIGVEPDEIRPADIDETVKPNELPGPAALRLASAKAAAAETHPPADELILGADTVVCAGRRLLGKPADAQEARRYLLLLSGRRHRVYSGIVLRQGGREISSRVVMTRLSFKRLSEAELAAYLQSGEWRGKAGGYAIQGRAALFVDWINGSYTNVVGLPLFETGALLRGAGYPIDSALAGAEQ